MILLFIFLSIWLGLALSSAYIALSITTVVFLFFVYKRFRLKFCLICSACFLIGLSCSFLKSSFHNDKGSYQGVVYTAKENYFLFNSGGERLYVYKKAHQYDIGDFLTIEGTREDLSFTTLESSFDFENYLNKKGVFKALNIKNVKVNFTNPIRITERRNKLLNNFNDEEKSLIGSMLFSDGGDSDLVTSIRELHLARFLAASGIFISAFYAGFKRLLSLAMKDKWAELISLGILSLYTIFTFPRFTVIKIMLFLIIRWINEYPLKKKFDYLTLISGFGIFCLICNRYLARQDSFILGFLIPIISYLSRDIFKKHKFKHWAFRYLIIYLFFIPFEATYYNKIVILAMPLQILFSPLFILIAFISLLCFYYVPLYPVLKALIKAIGGITSFLSPLSFGVNMPPFHQVLALLYFAIYLLWLIYLSKGFVPLYRLFLIVELSLLTIHVLPIQNSFSSEVDFVNVGQGDCTFIRSKNKTVLIDTGGLTYMDVANESLVPFLRKKRIYKIDAVFITHYDDDHCGALSSLSKTYKIGAVYDYNSTFPVTVGNLTFNNYNYYANTSDENDKSLVISFANCHKDFVIMGDAPSYIEKEIIKHNDSITCDILKVGHHGSNTSTCEDWLKYLSPKEAIVSCGKNNKYGHPNKEVVNLLNKYKIKIHRTDLEGTITYKQLFV